MKAELIPGEHGLRWHVTSRSNPQCPNLVDLASHQGYGQCSCRDWDCRVWPAIRDRTHPRHVRETTCDHIQLALRAFLSMALDLWIEQFSPDEC